MISIILVKLSTVRRLKEHNDDDKSRYTTKYRPWELLFSIEISEDRGNAMKLEKFLKAQKSKEFLYMFISEKKIQEDLLKRFG